MRRVDEKAKEILKQCNSGNVLKDTKENIPYQTLTPVDQHFTEQVYVNNSVCIKLQLKSNLETDIFG